jgi:hypothetical protein
MILALLIFSIILFCWATWQSSKIPEHKYDEPPEDKKEVPKPTSVFPDFVEQDEEDIDPPTVVMKRK